MARPRKPTNILNAAGAFERNPKRKRERANEPVPVGELGDPPSWMTAAQCVVWDEVKACIPQFTACGMDREAFIALVRMAEAVRQPKFILGATEAYMRALGRFGMTPADRSKVQTVRPAGDGNPFSKFGSAN